MMESIPPLLCSPEAKQNATIHFHNLSVLYCCHRHGGSRSQSLRVERNMQLKCTKTIIDSIHSHLSTSVSSFPTVHTCFGHSLSQTTTCSTYAKIQIPDVWQSIFKPFWGALRNEFLIKPCFDVSITVCDKMLLKEVEKKACYYPLR